MSEQQPLFKCVNGCVTVPALFSIIITIHSCSCHYNKLCCDELAQLEHVLVSEITILPCLTIVISTSFGVTDWHSSSVLTVASAALTAPTSGPCQPGTAAEAAKAAAAASIVTNPATAAGTAATAAVAAAAAAGWRAAAGTALSGDVSGAAVGASPHGRLHLSPRCPNTSCSFRYLSYRTVHTICFHGYYPQCLFDCPVVV